MKTSIVQFKFEYTCTCIVVVHSGNLLIERQKAMLLEVYKCTHELFLRYRHGMFS